MFGYKYASGGTPHTATEMTEKQRLAVEAMEGARSEGISLSDYAKTVTINRAT